ncbi:MAG: hypothetical protein AAF383_15305 [Cyanobacteria bacterium P01_A01_bin.83]
MIVPTGYESTIYCNRPINILKDIMQEAVNQYLSLHPKASLIENNDRSVVLKIPINIRSWGETMKISLEKESFHIVSECSVFFQIIGWGKNRDNFNAMCTCLENAISHRKEV